MLNWSNLLFPDHQYQTGGSNCEMSEITWHMFILKAVFIERKESLLAPLIKLPCNRAKHGCINGKYLDCKMQSVMVRNFNSLNYFLGGIESFLTQNIHVWLRLH